MTDLKTLLSRYSKAADDEARHDISRAFQASAAKAPLQEKYDLVLDFLGHMVMQGLSYEPTFEDARGKIENIVMFTTDGDSLERKFTTACALAESFRAVCKSTDNNPHYSALVLLQKLHPAPARTMCN